MAYEEIRPLTLFGASVAERARERKTAVVELHAERRRAKAIVGYLRVDKATVHRAPRRWPK